MYNLPLIISENTRRILLWIRYIYAKSDCIDPVNPIWSYPFNPMDADPVYPAQIDPALLLQEVRSIGA